MPESTVTLPGAGGNYTGLTVPTDAKAVLATAIRNLFHAAGRHTVANEIASGMAGKSGYFNAVIDGALDGTTIQAGKFVQAIFDTGLGKDTLLGNKSTTLFLANNQGDYIRSVADSTIIGGRGSDTISVTAKALIYLENGKNQVQLSGGNITLAGQGGQDTVNVIKGKNTVNARYETSVNVTGANQKDILNLAKNSTVKIGADHSAVTVSGNNETIVLRGNDDKVFVRGVNDTIKIEGGTNDTIVTMGGKNNINSVGRVNAQLSGAHEIDKLNLASHSKVSITGSNIKATIVGNNETIVVSGNHDAIHLVGRNDTIIMAGGHNDTVVETSVARSKSLGMATVISAADAKIGSAAIDPRTTVSLRGGDHPGFQSVTPIAQTDLRAGAKQITFQAPDHPRHGFTFNDSVMAGYTMSPFPSHATVAIGSHHLQPESVAGLGYSKIESGGSLMKGAHESETINPGLTSMHTVKSG
jgi:hypothetical protein